MGQGRIQITDLQWSMVVQTCKGTAVKTQWILAPDSKPFHLGARAKTGTPRLVASPGRARKVRRRGLIAPHGMWDALQPVAALAFIAWEIELLGYLAGGWDLRWPGKS